MLAAVMEQFTGAIRAAAVNILVLFTVTFSPINGVLVVSGEE